MCTKPLKITNPTKFYYRGATKRELIVPCGHCDECRAQKAQDWHLRIWSEVLKYNKLGGVCIFVTFTYKPECVPYFKWTDKDGNLHQVKCFNQRDKNTFLNSIRKDHEQRLGFTGKDSLPLRYIWTCEYGHGHDYIDNAGCKRKGQYQPHYHAILLFPPELVGKLGFKSENQWKRYIQNYWHYGWCRWSKPISKGGCGIFVTNEFAGEYVSKYMLKDLDFYKNPDLQDFLYDKDGNIIKDSLVQMKGRLPTHWQSLQFGADLCDLYNNEEALIHGLDLHLSGDTQKGLSKKSRAPRYVRRKLLYEPDKKYQNQRYVLSEFGVRVVLREFEETMLDRIKRFRHFFDYDGFQTTISGDDLKEIFKDEAVSFSSFKDLSIYLRSLLRHRDLIDLYLYDTVWSGLFVESSEYVSLSDLSPLEFMNVSLEQYLINNNKHFGEISGFCEDGFFKGSHGEDFFSMTDVRYYGSDPRFDDFDSILKYIHMCDSFVRARTNREYLKDRERRLGLNHELLEHEQRLAERFGSGFHSPYIQGCENPDLRKRSKDILARIRAKGINY